MVSFKEFLLGEVVCLDLSIVVGLCNIGERLGSRTTSLMGNNSFSISNKSRSTKESIVLGVENPDKEEGVYDPLLLLLVPSSVLLLVL